MRVRARGLTFDVFRGGPAGGGTVLLLHGFPQNSRQWAAVQPALWTAGLQTIAIDQRGYSPGARPDAVEAYRTVEAADDAAAVLDELGLAEVHVIGHDWGSLVAWQLAVRHPERVRTLTAVSVPHPAALWQALTDDADQQDRFSYAELFRETERAAGILLADDQRRLRRMFSGSGLGPEGIERYVAPMREPGALLAALRWYAAMAEPDYLGVGPVAVPTTYVWSDGDLAMGRTAAEACADWVKADYRFVELAGVTHWIPDQAPIALAEAALDRIAPRGAAVR
ncbi:alpha/beta fold hydrolase [Paractinoplanes durhamensis]|uniref:Epoxide hydrolase n=1 Tax=Paractinoplanes durhamensis TaxID=113563 RepID=A0ABQ3Z2Q2_9ACTN|nr:alpha/beta hydrolase [Actinoplanes durhamensis]GIE04096.1 epoxide hydrolase [Actinoplanes durhamensis]